MIVFPILNFVLPLMLTSFIFVNSQDCNECKSFVEFKNSEISELDNSKKSINKNNKNELVEKNLYLKTNLRNVH